MITNSLVKIKEAPPYTPELEVPVLMNSMARATLDVKTGSYSFPKKLVNDVTVDKANVKTIADIIAGTGSAVGVGVDQGTSYSLPSSITNPHLFSPQNSSLPFPLTILLSSLATSHHLKSRTATPSLHLLHRLRLVGRAKKLYSSRSVSPPKALLLRCKTSRFYPTRRRVHLKSRCTEMPKRRRRAKASERY